MNKGLFITFEGGEGSGKSTISKIVKEKLETLGYDVVWTREPGGTPIAEQIREIILNADNKVLTDEAEALLFAAARAQHMAEKIQPAVDAGKIVLCDRWLGSSLAYQGWARGMNTDAIKMINDFGIRGKRPDIQFFFDISVDEGFNRIKGRGAKDRMEQQSLAFHQNVLDYFRHEAKTEDYVEQLDATRSKEDLSDAVVSRIVMEYNKTALV